jgi:multiple sugar transport system substrate-binding protein
MAGRLWSRRRLLAGALGTGAAGLAVACGGGGGQQSSSRQAEPEPTTAPTAPAVHRGLTGSIVVAYADELGKKPKYVEQAAATVRQSNPAATVTVELDRVSASEFYPTLMRSLAAGDVPDVIHVAGDRIGELADAGYIAPLDDYVRDWPDWRYYSPTVKDGVTYRGQVWALPYGLDTRFLYYRRDVFERAGLPVDWQPKNVGEVLSAAAAVRATVKDVIPYALYAGPAGDSGSANHGLVPLILAYGGEIVDKNGRWIGDSAAIRKALAYYARAYQSERLVPGELLTTTRPWTSMREKLGNGGLALLYEGGWVYGGWAGTDRAGTEKNVGYLLHPAEREGPSFTLGGVGTCWFISAACAHKDLAWEFIAAFNTRDTVAHLNVEDPHPVARVDAVRVPEYSREKFLVDSTESLRRAYFIPPDPAYPKVIAAMQHATALVASGEAGPDDAAQAYTAELVRSIGLDRVMTSA